MWTTHNSGWMGLKSVPSTLAEGYFIARSRSDVIHGLRECDIRTKIYGPDAGTCCNVEDIVYSFVEGGEMEVPV